MTGRTKRLVSAAFVALLAACSGDDVLGPPPTAPLKRGDFRFTNMALTDPNPAAAGYFVANVSPETCFRNYTPDVVNDDADLDWLKDSCEFALAEVFRPKMIFTQDECPGWEPYWGAKVMMSHRVRIAYLLAYYTDCGYDFGIGGHRGDSEMIMLDLVFNHTTQHWMVESGWLSAHYQGLIDVSQGINHDSFEYWQKDRGSPQVWVSHNKHANYKNVHACLNIDWCYWPLSNSVRPPVLPQRNIGSRHRDLVGCVTSETWPTLQGTECFYTEQLIPAFKGWHRTTDAGAGSYRTQLMTLFEPVSTDNWDMGPGPDRPMYPAPPAVSINGSIGQVWAGGSAPAWFYAVPMRGTGPYTYQWTIDDGETTRYGTDQSISFDLTRSTWVSIHVVDTFGAHFYANTYLDWCQLTLDPGNDPQCQGEDDPGDCNGCSVWLKQAPENPLGSRPPERRRAPTRK